MGLGMTLPNLEFLGWRAPGTLDTKCDSRVEPPPLERMSLAEYYDPTGQSDVELLMINVSAVWCSVCRSEFSGFRNRGTYREYRARQVEFWAALFEDADHLPARPSDLSCWVSQFDVDFPMVLDPGFKTGPLFTSAATPMNLVVDTRTMRIIAQFPGAGGAITDMFGFIDRELARR